MAWPMIVAAFGLMIIGTAFIYSASTAHGLESDAAWYHQNHYRQLLAYGLGLILAVSICLVEYHVIARWSMVIYWFSILLLILVFFLGKEVSGATRWLTIGSFKLQPSELAKLSTICLLANFLSRPVDELRIPTNIMKAFALVGLPFVLILKEPDLGSALVFIPVGLAMMFIAGVPKPFLFKLMGGATIVIGLILVDVLLIPNVNIVELRGYQTDRLKAYFRMDFAPPNATPMEQQKARARQKDATYSVRQALISIGSGGLMGKGYCQGTQSALGYLPRSVAHNDFIFSVIAEETGFAGSLIVLILYAAVLFNGLSVASLARDRLGRTMAVGVITLWFTQVFINIGMNIRIMPVTGIPLPLLSYGGSSVLFFTCGFGACSKHLPQST